MMALTDDEKATLEALNKKANEPDDADDYEVEMTDENNRTIRVPYSKGKGLLAKWGFDLEDLPKPQGDGTPGDGGNTDGGNDGAGKSAGNGGKPANATGTGYFAKK